MSEENEKKNEISKERKKRLLIVMFNIESRRVKSMKRIASNANGSEGGDRCCLPAYFQCSSWLFSVRADIRVLERRSKEEISIKRKKESYPSKSCWWPRRSWASIINLEENICANVFGQSSSKMNIDSINVGHQRSNERTLISCGFKLDENIRVCWSFVHEKN